MSKVLKLMDKGELVGYLVRCLACEEDNRGSVHLFYHKMANGTPGWNFNGDFEKPTFIPSMLATTKNSRCHSIVTDGKIHYLNDCTHAMNGQVIDLQDFERE